MASWLGSTSDPSAFVNHVANGRFTVRSAGLLSLTTSGGLNSISARVPTGTVTSNAFPSKVPLSSTVLTRNWLTAKFSGWGVWLNDILFHALLAALVGDFPTARANLEAALEYQSPEGNLACLRTASQEWVDRSQSPIGAYVVWRIFELTGDRALLAEHFSTLLRAHRWWLAKRDGNGDGLIEYGSSPTGTGAFVHTKQGAMDESFMDNAPIFDRAGFDAEGLGFVAGGDEGGGVGQGGNDAGGLVAVLGMELLLYRREEAVEVDVEEAEEVGLSSRAHGRIIFAGYSPGARCSV